jgi:hypothetical protein
MFFSYKIKNVEKGTIKAQCYGEAIIELEKKIKNLQLCAERLKAVDVILEPEFQFHRNIDECILI